MYTGALFSQAADPRPVTVSFGVILAVFAGLVLAALAVAVVRVSRLSMPGQSLGSRLRAYAYLERFGAALDFLGSGDRERRARVRELKANLADSAGASGMSAALRSLGSPRALAASLMEGRVRPTWARGLVAFALALPVTVFAHVVLLDVWVSAAEAAGAGSAVGSSAMVPWATFSYKRGGDFGISSVWLLLLPVIAFLVWSRPWRVLAGSGSSPSVAVSGT